MASVWYVLWKTWKVNLWLQLAGKVPEEATSAESEEADEAPALDLGEQKSHLLEDGAPIAGEPLAAPVSQSRVYSFSLKRKADSSHMVSSKKLPQPELDLHVPRTGNAVFLFEFSFFFSHLWSHWSVS
jgi:hypothetical protein